MLELQDALALVLDAVAPLPAVEVPLQAALGYMLAETVVADRDAPATDRSAMDGFAVRSADCAEAGRRLTLTGEVRAGQDPGGLVVGAGEAVRVFTGATIPRGADAVAIQELVEARPDTRTVVVRDGVDPGQHVRRRGEDVRAGEPVAKSGTNARAAEIAVLAAVGRARVRIIPAPRVSVASTGDEIIDAGDAPGDHQVRNSNAAMLVALCRSMRIEPRDLGIVRDEPGALLRAIGEGLDGDVLVLTGGVSVGAYDLVAPSLRRAGCEVLFHNVAMRPGKPILVARRGRCLAVGLPGNPVSAFTGFHVFLAPALRKLMGHVNPVAELVRVELRQPLRRNPGRLTYHLAHLGTENGKPFVVPVAGASSGDVSSLARANAFIVSPGGSTPVPTGVDVDVLRWD